jgi:hypothetical protein
VTAERGASPKLTQQLKKGEGGGGQGRVSNRTPARCSCTRYARYTSKLAVFFSDFFAFLRSECLPDASVHMDPPPPCQQHRESESVTRA